MSTDYKFEGWVGKDPESAQGNMVWEEYEPKPWEETDVDIKITHSGICGSDVHTLRSGWVSTSDPHSLSCKRHVMGLLLGLYAVHAIANECDYCSARLLTPSSLVTKLLVSPSASAPRLREVSRSATSWV